MMKLLLVLSLAAAAVAKTKVVHADIARFSYAHMHTPDSGPCDVSEGPDRLVYVQEALANKIVRYNQHTGKLKEFPIPFTVGPQPNATTISIPGNAKALLLSCAIRNGFDGKMYFSNGLRNQLVQFDVYTEKVKVFTPPLLFSLTGNLQPLNDLTTAPDGVYFTSTSANTITKFDYKTHKFTPYTIPIPLSLTTGIDYASDGGIWFISVSMNKFGRFDRETKKFQTWSLPLPNGAGPAVIRAETKNKEGDYLLWMPTLIGGSLCSVNERTKKPTCYPDLPIDTTIEVAQDYQNNIWVTHFSEDSLGVFNPTHKNFTEIILPGTVLPAPVSAPLYVGTGIFCKPVGDPYTAKGKRPGRNIGDSIWFTELTANRLVRYNISGLVY